ncbi:HTH_38 domain-containing protein [Trichonephila clavipes]|uniref:HTH_38 domain-containing protein n=1 Tax=Trichonephila clavipes TaxID=2585209 RepID=A0A8X6UT96_TRICX|nr:HTH_38 domain-containing protein [Trichonephila clavipes]
MFRRDRSTIKFEGGPTDRHLPLLPINSEWNSAGDGSLRITVAQHIEAVTHHSVSVCAIRHRLQQSGMSERRPSLCQPWTQNHRVSASNGAMKEGCRWQNGLKLSLLKSHASVCNTTMVGFVSRDTVERGC